MASIAKLTNVIGGVNVYDLIANINISLTGSVSSTPIDGVLLTDGMYIVLSAQDIALQNGVYSVSVTSGTYTLTIFISLNTSATYTNPVLFVIGQGNTKTNSFYKFTLIDGITYFQDISAQVPTVKQFGAVGDGITNDAPAFVRAIAQCGLLLSAPPGTYLLEPYDGSGDQLLYLGGNSPYTSRSGLSFFGAGNSTVLKLGDNVGPNVLLFGIGGTDTLSDCTFSNFCIDLNGANNLQVNFNDPLRYNSGFYFPGYCENIKYQNVTIKNVSGSQGLRVGGDTPETYGKNIQMLNCLCQNFGIGIPNNKSQDTSMVYIQADGILIDGNIMGISNSYTIDPSKGLTGFELHGDNSTITTNNYFYNVQTPVLNASSQKPSKNIIVANNNFSQCNLLCSLDGSFYDQINVNISNNNFLSSVCVSSSIIAIGNSSEVAKIRDNILIDNNNIDIAGTTVQNVNVSNVTNRYLRKLIFRNNNVANLTGNLVYFAGVVKDPLLDFTIQNNTLDSLGGGIGGSPSSPTFVEILTTDSSVIKAVKIEGNSLLNSAAKDYTVYGAYRLGGNIDYLYVKQTLNTLSAAYPLVTYASPIVGTYKMIDSNYPIEYTSQGISIGAGATVTIATLAGFGVYDFAQMNFYVTFLTGTSNNGGAQFGVVYSNSGGGVDLITSCGAYATNIQMQWSTDNLQIKNTSGGTITAVFITNGTSTLPISWLH